jgi:hypothetical protein
MNVQQASASMHVAPNKLAQPWKELACSGEWLVSSHPAKGHALDQCTSWASRVVCCSCEHCNTVTEIT